MAKTIKFPEVKPKRNWKIGDNLLYKFYDTNDPRNSEIWQVMSINGYNTNTGELHLTLRSTIQKGGTREIINSAYDKERTKLKRIIMELK